VSALLAPSASVWEAGLVRVEVLFGLGSGHLLFLLPQIKVSDFYQKLHLHITILKDFLSDELHLLPTIQKPYSRNEKST
jgi:hypothetical protein